MLNGGEKFDRPFDQLKGEHKNGARNRDLEA